MCSDEKNVEVLLKTEQSGKSIQEVCRSHLYLQAKVLPVEEEIWFPDGEWDQAIARAWEGKPKAEKTACKAGCRTGCCEGVSPKKQAILRRSEERLSSWPTARFHRKEHMKYSESAKPSLDIYLKRKTKS